MSGQETITIEINTILNILITVILVVISAYFRTLIGGFEDDIKDLDEKVEELIKRCYSYHGQGRKKEKDG